MRCVVLHQVDASSTVLLDALDAYRLSARWAENSPRVAAAIAGFDETVSRPDRSVQLPTTAQVKAAHEQPSSQFATERGATRSLEVQNTGPVTIAPGATYTGPAMT